MSEDEVLTAEESDALLQQSDDAAIVIGGGVRDPDDDFWEQVAVDRNPEFEAINEALAEVLVAVWVRLFRREIVVNIQPPQRRSGREIAKVIDFEDGVCCFDIPSENEHCMFVVRPDTVSAMVDICFGGAGGGKRSERLSELTEMEKRLLIRFKDAMRDAVNEVLRVRARIVLQDSEKAFEAATHPLCEFNSRTTVSSFTFDIADCEHRVDFVWPSAFIDSLRSAQLRALPNTRERLEPDWSKRISEDLQSARIEVRAVIGGIPIRLNQISQAKRGDVIMTDSLDKVCLFAGGKPVFEGTLGTHKGFNAVKITRPFVQRRFGEA
jgi:flagellar motor switch protein FliM